MASNWWLHCWQTYSKIGISDGSVKIVTAIIIIGQAKALTTKEGIGKSGHLVIGSSEKQKLTADER
jgi:hypothetical protein